MPPENSLSAAIDDEVAGILESTAVTCPPVDAIEIARRLGIVVALDARQASRGRRSSIAGRQTIFVRPEDRPERQQWAVAHELGETLAHELFRRAGTPPEDVRSDEREAAANLAAARLLLPAAWFVADAARLAGDLPLLKERYATASHELIALRLLDLPVPAVITVFDHGRPTRRRGNLPVRPPPLDRVEQECWLTVHRFARCAAREEKGRRVQGWPLHEPGWPREILRTTYTDWE